MNPKRSQISILAVCCCLLVLASVPFIDRATTIKDFSKNETPAQKAVTVVDYVDKIIADVKTSDPDLAKNIHDYFYKQIPDGKNYVGEIDFETEVKRQLHEVVDHKKTMADLDEVEVILTKVIEKHVNITLKETDGKFVATVGAPADVLAEAQSPTSQPATLPAPSQN